MDITECGLYFSEKRGLWIHERRSLFSEKRRRGLLDAQKRSLFSECGLDHESAKALYFIVGKQLVPERE